MDLILQGSSFSAAHSLDKLYQTALSDAGRWDDGDFVKDFCAIMGMVLVLKNPLSSSAIDTLRGIPEHRIADDTIKRLNCLVSSTLLLPTSLWNVVTPPNGLELVHGTFLLNQHPTPFYSQQLNKYSFA